MLSLNIPSSLPKILQQISKFPKDSLVEQTVSKYSTYQSNGHLILSVTLSTYISDSSFACSSSMRSMWDHFLLRVERYLPQGKLHHYDSDFVIECNDDGFYGFHGLLALKSDVEARIWKDQKLNKHLVNDLRSFRNKGKYRKVCINSFCIENLARNPEERLPHRSSHGEQAIKDWVYYIYKRRQLKITNS